MGSPVPSAGQPAGQEPLVRADLAPFWEAWEQVRQEHARLPNYTAARDFWTSYDTDLANSIRDIGALRRDMETNTGWSGGGNATAASTAFYGRIDAGIGSMRRWVDGGTAAVRDGYGTLVERLEATFRTLDEERNLLLQQQKVSAIMAATNEPVMAPITERDRSGVLVRQPTAAQISSAVTHAVRLRDELQGMFGRLTEQVGRLPSSERWQGPTTVAGVAPPGGPPATGPGGAPPGGPAGPGGAPPGGPAGPGGAPPGGPTGGAPTGSGPTGDDPAAQQSTSDTGTDTGSQEQGADTATDPATDPSLSQPPPTDPALTGTPVSTTPSPTANSALSPTGTAPLGSVPSGVSPTGHPGTGPSGSPLPLTPVGTAPLPATSTPPPPRPGTESPVRGSSTVDGGARAGGSGGSAGGPAVGPRTAAAAGAGDGRGFYPPIVPPMVPPGGGVGGAGGGVRPGEAEFGGGLARRTRGQDSWRAGLRSQLLGRTGQPNDEEPEQLPPVPPPGGEVLDEELWQVPGAAPVTPPEPPSRRSRPWD